MGKGGVCKVLDVWMLMLDVKTVCNVDALLLIDEKFVSEEEVGTGSQTVGRGNGDVDGVSYDDGYQKVDDRCNTHGVKLVCSKTRI